MENSKKIIGDSGGDALSIYLKEISDIPVLSKEEEKELAKRIKNNNDTEAVKTLVKHNLKFVVSLVKKYKNLGVPFLDLINEGNLGLIKAAKKFDPDKDVKFISYASWWIKQSVMKYLMEQNSPIKIPVKVRGKNRKIDNITKDYQDKFHTEPTKKEIMDKTGFSKKELNNANFSRLSFDSFDQTIGESKHSILENFIDENAISLEDYQIKKSLIEDIYKYISGLPEREQDIINMRFGLKDGKAYTLKDIGKKYNISKERVRQLEAKTLSKIKKEFKSSK